MVAPVGTSMVRSAWGDANFETHRVLRAKICLLPKQSPFTTRSWSSTCQDFRRQS
jgi:hypothetical protein